MMRSAPSNPDKATMDVPSSAAGVVKEVKVALGDKVAEGSLLIVVEAAGATAAAPATAAAAPLRPRCAGTCCGGCPGGGGVVEVKVPDIGDFRFVPVIELFVKVGDRIAVDDAICTLESDKATMDVPSSAAGVVKEVLVSVGDKVAEGSVLLKVEAAGAAASAPGCGSAGAKRSGRCAPSAASHGCRRHRVRHAGARRRPRRLFGAFAPPTSASRR